MQNETILLITNLVFIALFVGACYTLADNSKMYESEIIRLRKLVAALRYLRKTEDEEAIKKGNL